MSVERLDILILSQGTVLYGRAEYEPDGWDRVMRLNADSVMSVCRAAYPALEAAQGRVVIVSSVAGLNAAPGNPAYAASKHAAIGLTKSLGAAWARAGVRVNGIAPGMVETKLTRVTTESPERLKATLSRIPTRRLGTPQDMAGAALFLASDASHYVCGQTLVVDGGLTLG